MLAVRMHLALLFAVEEVVVVLHTDEGVPAVALGDVIEVLEFPCVHLDIISGEDIAGADPRTTYRARADISHFSTLYHVVESAHDLFWWRVTIEAVDLQNIDVCAQSNPVRTCSSFEPCRGTLPGNTIINGIHDVLPTQPHTID